MRATPAVGNKENWSDIDFPCLAHTLFWHGGKTMCVPVCVSVCVKGFPGDMGLVAESVSLYSRSHWPVMGLNVFIQNHWPAPVSLVKGRLKPQPPLSSTGYGRMENKRFLTRPDECFSSPSAFSVKKPKAEPCKLIPASLLIMVVIMQANGLSLYYLLGGDGGLIFCADKLALERWLEAVCLLYIV